MESIMISALQHFAYCPRQCALIHMEQVFEENEYTMKGNFSHKRVHEQHNGSDEQTSLTLWSDAYGLSGQSDVVEWVNGKPYPVEYKQGRLKKSAKKPDEIQLCAQAICLEEMFSINIQEGAIYHVSSHQRRVVELTEDLRSETIAIISLVRDMIDRGRLPEPLPTNDARCEKCSLKDLCMPEVKMNNSWRTELERGIGRATIT
ncbi:MAG: CRISPR-associated protein Cas4 [Bacilli bacterium]|nr:CRISPR-associated protein Cas4 [Bacilli bacterium]